MTDQTGPVLLWSTLWAAPSMSVDVFDNMDGAVAAAAHFCDGGVGVVNGIELADGTVLTELDDLFDVYWETHEMKDAPVVPVVPRFRVVISGPLGDGVYTTGDEATAEAAVFEVQNRGVMFERVIMEPVKP